MLLNPTNCPPLLAPPPFQIRNRPGNLTITSSDAVPLLAPVGPYSMRMQAWDQDGAGVMCIDIWFRVVAAPPSPPPSPSPAPSPAALSAIAQGSGGGGGSSGAGSAAAASAAALLRRGAALAAEDAAEWLLQQRRRWWGAAAAAPWRQGFGGGSGGAWPRLQSKRIAEAQ